MVENLEKQDEPKVEQAEAVGEHEPTEDSDFLEKVDRLIKEADEAIAMQADYGQETVEKIAQEAGVAVDEAIKDRLAEISGEAIQAGDELKQELGEISKETKEAETTKQEFEYRDAEGNLIGKAIVEMSQEEVEGLGGIKGKMLKSFRLEGEKDGESTSVDVLELANLHKVKIILARGANYSFDFEKREIIAPPLESPIDVGILLHELGHADQDQDEKIEGLSDFYGLKIERPYTLREEGVAQEKTVERLAQTIIKAAPLTEKIIKRTLLNDNFSELIKIQTEHRDIFLDRNKAEDALKENTERISHVQQYLDDEFVSKLTEEEHQELKNNLDNLQREREALLNIKKRVEDIALTRWRALRHKRDQVYERTGLEESDFEEFFEKLLYLPTQIMERDATARALKWMRKIRRDTGVDLFVKAKVPARVIDKPFLQRCATSVQEGMDAPKVFEADSLKALKSALGTYGAEKPPLAKRRRQKAKKE